MKDDSDLRLLNELRVGVVHQQSLIPASTAWVGYCKYGEPRLGFGNFQSPLNNSLGLLLLGRHHLANYVHPHRAWIGEELGVSRKWALSERPDTELVTFCISSWEKLASVVTDAHAWRGAKYTPSAKCGHDIKRLGLLLESDVFPEVPEAWAGSPNYRVTPRDESLPLLRAPDESADTLHTAQKPALITGWLSERHRDYWDPRYRSMLVYAIDGTVVNENTAVFFEVRKAVITAIPETEREEPAEESAPNT
jgi:hypothetical protein